MSSIALPLAHPVQSKILTVGVCSFRRLSLEKTLRSLAVQSVPGVTIRIVVCDNDEHGFARLIVERVNADLKLNIRYLHAPSRNISIARNACLEACADNTGCAWLAFIDDDEIATAGWLAALFTHMRGDIAAVFGPVKADYQERRGFWLSSSDYHSIHPQRPGGEIRDGYTGNVLINLAHPAVKNRRFDIEFGRSGGEDRDYFDAIHRHGGRFHFVPQAIVVESVPPDRDRLTWLMRRFFRAGHNVNRIRIKNGSRIEFFFLVMKQIAAILIAIALISFLLFSRRRATAWLLRICYGIGFIFYFFNIRPILAYGSNSARGNNG
jgi:succinoglycan biosynthesis protein ExoM